MVRTSPTLDLPLILVVEISSKMLVLVVGFVLVVAFVFVRWNEVKYCKKGLPPGTMGLPVVGETTEFLRQGPNFMKNQRQRYGSMFKTHILGCPTVVCMDPDINRTILMSEREGLVPGYPQSMLDILGRSNIAAVHGPLHKTMRGALLALVNPNMIRDKLLPKVDEFMRSHLSNLGGTVVDIQDMTKEMAFLSSLKQIAGVGAGPISEAFKPEFYKLVVGTLSLPINLPGTNYRKGLEGRKKIISTLRKILKERKLSKERRNDMLEHLLEIDEDSRLKLTEEQIIDMIITIIYSGFETVSTTSMVIVKYLTDNPKALQELRKEHMTIRQRKSPEDPINWDDFKSMNFTRAVIYESMRLVTVVNGVLRKTTQDMEINGYLIPKGWRIYVYTREINYDSLMHVDPLAFNPWRWLENNLEGHKHFLLFGGGTRLCPGKESGVAEISTFLHYLVTRYRWAEVQGNTLLTFPRVQAPNGLHIQVWDY